MGHYSPSAEAILERSGQLLLTGVTLIENFALATPTLPVGESDAKVISLKTHPCDIWALVNADSPVPRFARGVLGLCRWGGYWGP